MTADNLSPPDGHVTDADLLALHDDDPSVTAEARAHLATCVACGERLARVRDDALLVTQSLTALPMPALDVPAVRRAIDARRGRSAKRAIWRNPLIQIGAALAVATAAAASVGPIRALIGRREARPVAPAPAPKRSAPDSMAPTETAVAFAVSGQLLTIRFDSVPAGGNLEIEPGAATNVSAQPIATSGDRRDAIVVLPNELRIRNGRSSRASYRVMVPGSVEQVRVVVGGRVLLDGQPRRSRIGLSDRIGR